MGGGNKEEEKKIKTFFTKTVKFVFVRICIKPQTHPTKWSES